MSGTHTPRWLAGAAVLVMLAVGACAARPASPEQAKVKESIDTILNQPLAEGQYGSTPRRCISRFAYRDFEPLSDRYLLFKGPGNKLWLNELHGMCPGLRHTTALAFDLRGSEICELDQFKVTDWFDWSRYRRWPWHWLQGVPCTLGKFQPVTGQQVEALRGALKGQ